MPLKDETLGALNHVQLCPTSWLRHNVIAMQFLHCLSHAGGFYEEKPLWEQELANATPDWQSPLTHIYGPIVNE